MNEEIKPEYKFVEEEGDIAPVRRKIAKTMKVTENFCYYDVLAYIMKMEKTIEDKKAEITGLEAMAKAYRNEIELIEQVLDVTKIEEKYQLDLHEKLKAEEAMKEEKSDENIQGN